MKKIGLVLVVGLIIIGLVFFYTQQKNSSKNPLAGLTETTKEIKPSETFIDYSDPAGFSFSYPDNLSLKNSKAESEVDSDAYADLQLYSKDKSGSITLRIVDSEFATSAAWLKANNIPSTTVPVDKKLGELKAVEVKTGDRLLLGTIDQGVLFTVEMPLIEQDFWMKVYEKVLKDFTFAAPPVADSSQGTSDSSADDVTFEAEEVIE